MTWAELEGAQFDLGLEDREAPHRIRELKAGGEPLVPCKPGSGKCFQMNLLIPYLLPFTMLAASTCPLSVTVNGLPRISLAFSNSKETNAKQSKFS